MDRKVLVFIVLLVFFISVYSAVAFYTTTPKPSQPFIGFGVFNQSGSLSGYVPGLNQMIPLNQTIKWQLNITNEMGAVQFVQTVFKLGNRTSVSPNATSPALTVPELANSTLFVPNRETGVIYFSWRVVKIVSSGGLDFLKLDVNGQQMMSAVGAASGRDFRLFFELWTFDEPSGAFQYGWQDMGSRVGSWLQVWFSVSP